PNSAVKRRIADGSVGFPHARVGHRQAPIADPRAGHGSGVFAWPGESRPSSALFFAGLNTQHQMDIFKNALAAMLV
ncbi:hypothetical protein R4769_20810, partial [Azotobacter beijerinckii]|uniref:hypothetical protein n=1 Tax=Azotobacter beijerinckii TaxID=170623 RepID=UPI00295351D8